MKNSSQKILSKNPPKKSSQKISPKKTPSKKFCQKDSSKKSFGKIPKKFLKKIQKNSKNSATISTNNPKNFQTISQKIPKILKIFNSLHRTWRPKTLSGLFLYISSDPTTNPEFSRFFYSTKY